jgi:hypothetical protein
LVPKNQAMLNFISKDSLFLEESKLAKKFLRQMPRKSCGAGCSYFRWSKKDPVD